MATLVNTSTESLDVYIGGLIQSEGGISVFTDPDHKMYPPVTLYPGVPYLLNRFNLEQVFNADHLVVQGITKNEVIYGNGLPEDDYTICLQAFNYDTGEPVSAESPQGCSNMFSVMDLEAPVILQPFTGDTIPPATPQNITFVWTYPPGAPSGIRFNLQLFEVLPGTRDINDAVKTASYPVFFEATVSFASYVLGPADPALVEGKTYAVMVTAFDPKGELAFRNYGNSEVIGFTYRKSVSPEIK
jgi:TANFOR domain-containing protein